MVTSQLLGHFRSDPRTRAEFLNMIGRASFGA
jgi:GTP cyclohydrolase I